jgi:hypothetical protein
MLTPAEEATLKRLAAEHTPMSRPAVDLRKAQQPDTGDYLQRELARCEKIVTVNAEEDFTVINRLRDANVLGKKERLMEFFSRTGLGRAQLLSMSKSAIQSFVRQAEANTADSAPAPEVRAILT